MKALLNVLVFLAGSIFLPVQAQTPDELHTAYELAAAESDVELETALLAVQSDYNTLLDNFIAYSQKRGKLEAVLWAQKEKERFDAEKSIVVDRSAPIPKKVIDTQARHQKILQASTLKWASLRVRLSDQYTALLAARVKKLTRDGKIEVALALRRTIDEVNQKQALVRARTHLQAYGEGRGDALARAEAKRSEVVLFEVDFSGDKLDAPLSIPPGYAHKVDGGKLQVFSNSTKLILDKKFEGDFRVELFIEKLGEKNHSEWDYKMYLPSLGVKTELLFRGNKFYRAELQDQQFHDLEESGITSPGVFSLAYRKGSVQCAFRSAAGDSIESEWIHAPNAAGPLGVSIQIAGNGEDSPRVVDQVRVVSIPSTSR